jgi:hypothetical protein
MHSIRVCSLRKGVRHTHLFTSSTWRWQRASLVGSRRFLQHIPHPTNSTGGLDNAPLYQYSGPLTETWKRLKLFSFASLGLAAAITPFFFILESTVPMAGRAMLGSVAIASSSLSTALIGWCAAPYVTSLTVGHDGAIKFTTKSFFMKSLETTVYDKGFLRPATRYMAHWQLAKAIRLSNEEDERAIAGLEDGKEETVAETRNEKGDVLGWWAVRWRREGDNYVGECTGSGSIVQ